MKFFYMSYLNRNKTTIQYVVCGLNQVRRRKIKYSLKNLSKLFTLFSFTNYIKRIIVNNNINIVRPS